MRHLPSMLVLLGLAGCGSRDPAGHPGARTANAPDSTRTAMNPVPAGWQPEAFLDSVGRLPTAALVARATHYADSVFTHQPQLGRVVGAADMTLLRQARRTGFLRVSTAQRIFGDTSITARCNWLSEEEKLGDDKVQVRYVPFGADEYALCVGAPVHCAGAAMYFFKGNRLLARHLATFNGESLKHYRDAEGHVVVYYLYGFESGSGIWWNQYFFYRYEGHQLVPVLNELENGNLRMGWDQRAYWLEATVQKTNPLTLKMVYNVELPDTASTGPFLLSDSTLVEYRWNPQTHQLEGQYAASKITRPQVLSYYVQNNDLLFINAYYQRLKQALADSAGRPAARRYLWAVRWHYGRPQRGHR